MTVFYIDVRTPGKAFDEFYRRAVEEFNVHYIKGQVGKVLKDARGGLTVLPHLFSDKHLMLHADMVILATAVKPAAGARKLATMLTAKDG